MATKNSINTSYPVEVAAGGTGAASLTDHAVLVGSGTGAITALTAGTNGQVVVGSTGAEPTFASVSAGTGMTVTGGAGTLSLSSTATTLNNQTGTTYTLVLTDAGKMVTLNNGAAITLTIPLNASVAFAIGTMIMFQQLGAGQVTFSSSATMQSYNNAYKLTGQYSACSILKTASDTWCLAGDLTT